MGLLFIGALAGILISFGWLAPSQGYVRGCAERPCFDSVAVGQSLEPKPVTLGPAPAIARTAPANPRRSGKSPPAKKRARVDLANVAPPRTRIGTAASDRAADIPDAVLNRAKLTVAAKIEYPQSAEFSDMKRAMRKNTLGRPMDTICGHVKGKNASGGETGERPFLYLVKEDDAYVVDGKPDSAASIAYRNICN